MRLDRSSATPRSLARRLGLAARAAATALLLGAFGQAHAAPTGCANAVDPHVPFPYPIHATWMFPRDSACEWQQALEGFHRLGGRVVMQFAPALEKLGRDGNTLWQTQTDGRRRRVLDDCRHPDGRDCVEAAVQDLAAQGIVPDRIANWLATESNEPHGDGIVCAGNSLDRRIETRRDGVTRTVWRIVLRHGDQQAPCDYASGRFDVLFVTETPGSRGQSALLEVADALGMEVFLGAPAFSVMPRARWQADQDMTAAMLDWSQRVFRDLGRRYATRASFKGVYQSFEVALQPGWKGDGYDLYEKQAKLLRTLLPGKKYVVSPYFYVNRRQQGTDLAGTVDGFRRLARAGVDLILPQDGRGTGKAALYWPWQRNMPVAEVDPQLANFAHVDGKRPFAEQFAASTAELYAALRQATVDLAARESVAVQLWPNVEAFEEDVRDPGFVGCGDSGLSQTTKARLDRAITSAGPAARIVSFMYDPLFTCRERYGTSLADAIASDHDRPLLVQAAYAPGAAAAIAVQGYHLLKPGSRFEIVWQDGSARPRIVTPRTRQEHHGKGVEPDRVLLEFDGAASGRSSRLSIVAIAPDGRRSHEPIGITTLPEPYEVRVADLNH